MEKLRIVARVLIVFTALGSVALQPLFAQITSVTADQAPPVPGVGHDYIKMLNETVNPATGAVSITISVPVPKARGFTIPFSFSYNSNQEHHRAGATLGFEDNTSYLGKGGWSYVIPNLSFNPHTIQWTPVSGGIPYTCTFYNDYIFQDPKGVTHSLYMAIFTPNNSSNCEYPSNSTPTEYLSGGDAWVQATTSASFSAPSTIAVADASGTVYNFSYFGSNIHSVNNVYSLLPTSIEDRNGNMITITDSGNGKFLFPDTTGRNALATSGFGSTGNTVTVSGLSPYTVTWGASNADWSYNEQISNDLGSNTCGTPGTYTETLNQSYPEITNIELPNNKSYQFQYSDAVSGLLTKIIYPTGGYVRYVWGTNSLSDSIDFYPDENGSFVCHQLYDNQAVTDRYVSFDGSTEPLHQHFTYYTNWLSNTNISAAYKYWSYKTTTVTTYISGTSYTTTYTYLPYDILSNPYDQAYSVKNYELEWAPVVVQHPIPVEGTVVYGSSSGATLLTTTKGWLNQYQPACMLRTLDNGEVSGEFYSYAPGGMMTDKKEYDYTQGVVTTDCQNDSVTLPTASPIREIITTPETFADTPIYPSAPSILDRPASVQTNGNGTEIAITQYTYDGTLTSVANLPPGTHDETNYSSTSTAPRGNTEYVQRTCLTTGNCVEGTTTYRYDETGQTTSRVDPCQFERNHCNGMSTAGAAATQYSYADSYDSPPAYNTNTYVTQITNLLGQSTSYKYAYSDGQLIQSTDLNGLVTQYTYNDTLRRLTLTSYPDGGTTAVSYNDTAPTPSVTTSKTINSTKTIVTTSVMDGASHVTENELTSDPQGTVFTDTTYDGLGRVATVSNPHRTCGTDPTSTCGTTTYAYDSLSRKTSVTYADSSVLTTAYCGPSTLVTDPSKRWRRSRTDALGRLIEVDEPNSTTATVNSNGCPGGSDPIWVTSYTFDPLNDLLSVLQNGSHQRTFVYNSLAQLTSSTNPEVGTITYAYDFNGNLDAKTDARGISTTYARDKLNRETSRTYSNGDPTVTTTYDGTACLGLTACQNIGHRTSMTDAAGSESWAYQTDATNLRNIQWDQRTTTSGSNNITETATTYMNLAGNVYQEIYPSGRTVNYTYDAADRPSTAVDGSNGITYATDWQTGLPSGCVSSAVCYTPQGTPYALSIGQTSSFTGLNITDIYNSRLQPQEFKASSSGGSAIDISYSYNDPVNGGNAGHVFSITNNLNTSRSQAFAYDQVNRMISAGTTSTTGTYCWGYLYSYDAWANLTSQAGWTPNYNACSEPVLPGVIANSNNQLTSLSYDASGNTTSDGLYSYTWNGEGEQTAAAGVSYTYDGDGRRVSKVGSKLYWYGPSNEILAETNASGNTLNEYIFFGGKRIAMLPAGSAAQYYVEDALGSSRIVATNTGTVCYDADFYPYGGERTATDTCTQNNYKFEGKERDVETGNDNFDARYYSYRFGRWLSADWSSVPVPVPYANLTNPQTLNLYAMVADDPESFEDLDGHEGEGSSQATNCNALQPVSCGQTTTVKTESSISYSPYGQSFNGQGASSVTLTQSTVTTTTTTAADGSTTTTTAYSETKTTAYFSLKDGGYLGANQSTGDGVVMSKPTEIGMDKANQVIGGEAMNKAAALAVPGSATGTMQGVNETISKHYVNVGVGILGVVSGILAAPENPKAGYTTAAAGLGVLWCAAGGPGC